MKNIRLTFYGFILIVSLFILTTTAPSCKKKETCQGKVIVRDTNGLAVAGALVRLDAFNANPPGQIKYGGATDKYGKIEFDIKLPAIFDVTAQSAAYPDMFGKGVLNVDEPGKEADVTVVLVY